MNNQCHGDYVPSLKLYRCFLDGTFIAAPEKPTHCSNCRREAIPATARRPKLRTLVQKQVRLRISSEYSYFTYEIEGNPAK